MRRTIRSGSGQHRVRPIGDVGKGLELRRIVGTAELERQPRRSKALLGMAETVGADAGVAEQPDRLQPVAILDRGRRRDEDLLTAVDIALPDRDMAEEGFDVGAQVGAPASGAACSSSLTACSAWPASQAEDAPAASLRERRLPSSESRAASSYAAAAAA